VGGCDFFAHPTSVTQFSFSRENSREMSAVMLMIRKIVLYFFLITSPILPLFYLYPPARNIGKTWLTILIQWILYAPLFALFLRSAVYIFNNMPLPFSTPDVGDPSKIIFPTSLNILMGMGKDAPSTTNSLNITETFAQYVFALLMLWAVIILPWVLMRIRIPLNDKSIIMKSLVSLNTTIKSAYHKSITSMPFAPDQYKIPNTPFVKKDLSSVGKTDNAENNKTS
jgi:hypothetical protein